MSETLAKSTEGSLSGFLLSDDSDPSVSGCVSVGRGRMTIFFFFPAGSDCCCCCEEVEADLFTGNDFDVGSKPMLLPAC
jgi:hypothetical protein